MLFDQKGAPCLLSHIGYPLSIVIMDTTVIDCCFIAALFYGIYLTCVSSSGVFIKKCCFAPEMGIAVHVACFAVFLDDITTHGTSGCGSQSR